MPAKRIKDFLDGKGAKYVSISHSPAFTAQEIAASAHIPGKELAKTVVVKLDGKLALAVLPASFEVDFDLLKEAAAAGKAELATEDEFDDAFAGCEVGAMPPLGNLYGMEAYVDESLVEDDQIAFNAGTHHELIQMAYTDYERLANPKVARFGRQA